MFPILRVEGVVRPVISHICHRSQKLQPLTLRSFTPSFLHPSATRPHPSNLRVGLGALHCTRRHRRALVVRTPSTRYPNSEGELLQGGTLGLTNRRQLFLVLSTTFTLNANTYLKLIDAYELTSPLSLRWRHKISEEVGYLGMNSLQ